MKSLYSIPSIFHLSRGFPDAPDYIRVCAHNNDTMSDVLKFYQSSPENMLYGPFTTIEYYSSCNVRNAERTHYKLNILPGSKPCPHTEGNQTGNTSDTKA